ncbi:MAG: hypothetical protein Q4A78_02725 [Peptostreptococcaceae bacterium]|nr:hypothetical protein [Peptostreptococcaceae bacterium]
MDIRIIFEYDNEQDNQDYCMKGYRDDVIVEKENRRYKLYAATLERIEQNFEVDFRLYHYPISEANTILVKEATKEEIRDTIVQLDAWMYFEQLDNKGFIEKEAIVDSEA